jgi:hypothetical protein
MANIFTVITPSEISALLTRTWFGRVWTIQEQALSSATTVVVCGEHSMLWDSFSRAAEWWFFGSVVNVFLNDVPLDPFFNQRRIRLSLAKAQTDLDLVDFLTYAREHRATKPEDKIYGVFSLLQHAGLSMPDPDYTVPVSTLCEQVTIATIFRRESLDIFDILLSHRRNFALPSWVPDWTAPSLKGCRVRRDLRFARRSKLDIRVMATRTSGMLPLAGKTVCQIIECCEHSGFRIDLQENESVWQTLQWHLALANSLRAWFSFSCIYRPSLGTPADNLVAFQESFLSYHKPSKHYKIGTTSGKAVDWTKSFAKWTDAAYTSDREDFEPRSDDWAKWIKGLFPSWRRELTDMREDPDARFLYRAARTEVEYWKLTRDIYERVHKRTPFVTDDGHLGIGPCELQERDLIVLFPSALSPMVVRPHGLHFRLIGPAIIHGLMGGTIRVHKSTGRQYGVMDEHVVWPKDATGLDLFMLV